MQSYEEMRIVITGGNSFIGSALMQKAISAGCQVILVMRPGHEKISNSKVSTVYATMDDYFKLGKLIGRCDCMVNLAWNGTRGMTRMNHELQESNYFNTMQGIRSMLNVGCKRIVTAGSQAEYGPHVGPISEDTICKPNTEYGIAKINLYNSMVRLCEEYSAEYKEPRFFSLYGPGDYQDTMIMSMLKNMMAGKTCKLTEGIQMWDFLYISDAIEGIWKLCSKKCADGAYNFGSGDVRQLREYVLEMANLMNTKSSLEFGAVPYPETGMVSIWPNVNKMWKELHWKAKVTFKDGITKILESINVQGTMHNEKNKCTNSNI